MHSSKNWLFIKVPQFLTNPYDKWSKLSPDELIILTKFHKDCAKIVQFFLIANFCLCAVFLTRLQLESNLMILYVLWNSTIFNTLIKVADSLIRSKPRSNAEYLIHNIIICQETRAKFLPYHLFQPFSLLAFEPFSLLTF